MSDILIRGMEMPMGGRILIVFPSGRVLEVSADATQEIFRETQVIPVPPHGRLIDAGKMRKSIRKQTAFIRLIGGEFAEIAETLEKGFLQEIDNAPTVIPADQFGDATEMVKKEGEA